MVANKDVTRDIDEILTEIRIVLPGTETLLGFQFAAFFTGVFRQLENAQRFMHLINLVFVATSTVLLIAIPAIHQFREEGRDTENFLIYARRLLLAAMFCLAIGLSGDIFVGTDITLNNDFWAAVTAFVSLLFILVLWFGHKSLKRKDK